MDTQKELMEELKEIDRKLARKVNTFTHENDFIDADMTRAELKQIRKAIMAQLVTA